MLSLRPAQPADTATITRFIRELAEYEKLSHECHVSEQALAEHLFGPAPKAEVILAEWAGEAVGFALFFTTFSTFLAKPGIYLEDLYVRPEMRGKGLGKAMLAYLAALAVERGCGRLEWSVLDWNAPSIAFYESLGARPKTGWTDYRLKEEALLRTAELHQAAQKVSEETGA
jgi:GNAT superfamily N-acetyltransferase